MRQERETKVRTTRRRDDTEIEETPVEVTPGERTREDILDEVEEILENIDEVLEECEVQCDVCPCRFAWDECYNGSARRHAGFDYVNPNAR